MSIVISTESEYRADTHPAFAEAEAMRRAGHDRWMARLAPYAPVTLIMSRYVPGPNHPFLEQWTDCYCPWPRPQWWESTMMMAREGN